MNMTDRFHPLRLTLLLAALGLMSLMGLPSTAGAFEVPASAIGRGAIHDGDANVESRLLVDVTQVAPGDTITVGVAFQLKTDWHIYWKYPGDAGVPTHIDWQSAQLEFGPLQWAAPNVFSEADGEMTVYGYGDEVLLFSEATVSPDAQGTIELAASVDYLACNDLCMPGHSRLTRTIAVGPETIHAEASLLDAFGHWGQLVPRRASDLGLTTRYHYSQDSIRPNDEFDVLIELIECEDASGDCRDLTVVEHELGHTIIPDLHTAPSLNVTDIAPHPKAHKGWLIHVLAKLPADVDPADNLLSGVIELKQSDGRILPVYLRDVFQRTAPGAEVARTELPFGQQAGTMLAEVAPPSAKKVAPPALSTKTRADAPGAPLNLGWVLILAFLGGMILNLMPCVFPVLALKVSSFATVVHESRRGIVTHGAAYTAGILGSMLLLAGVVIGLRVGGTQVGWGFQFQQPHFLAALIIILVLFALNLFGVFEVTLNAQGVHDKAQASSGVRRSVWEGVLAVILATPCSAPFLGTAVGFALASGPITIIAVFLALGLGLAAPMVVLTLVPGWAKLLPRPGNWMVHLKTFLGFALLGSAIWIFWLLGRQVGVDAMIGVLIFTTVLGMAAWIFGLVQFNQWSAQKVGAMLLIVALLAGGATLAFPLKPAPADSRPAQSQELLVNGELNWIPWSDEAVQAALRDGQPVFVDFGADWCLTCKVNQKNAIETDPVRQAVARHNVATFYADWTNPDERIRLKLAEYGKAGVPFYLVYSPASPQTGRPLPEVLTADMLVTALAEAAQ